MVAHQPAAGPPPPRVVGALGRYLRLIAASLAMTGLAAGVTLFALWYHVWTSSLTARWIRIHVYEELLAVYAVALGVIPIGLMASSAIGLRARRIRDRRLATRSGRVLLACLSLLAGVGISEAVCAWQLRRLARLDHLPSFPAPVAGSPTSSTAPKPLRDLAGGGSRGGTIDVVTIGGSSAHGVPFSPRLSLDRIITWQLGRAFPERSFRNDNRAVPGITLERAIERLDGLERRPDLLIVYSGHNEFQSRFGWGRKVPHYRAEPKAGVPMLARRFRAWSWTAEFLGTSADRFATELAPPPRNVRDPADSPNCTPAEYAATLDDYRRRLDGLLGDCDAAGILTLVVVPPSNDAFDPNRSVLSADTPLAGQLDFMARFAEVRRAESADPGGAMSGYRRLIAEQPGFAETHFRLARLLEAAGSYGEAHEAYIRARDLDGSPFRCQTPFLEACRAVAIRHGSIVVDGPSLLASASPHGFADDRLFADAHHPALNSFVILARDAIRQLKARKAFGWPDLAPAPRFTMADCIAHFGLDVAAWIQVCRNSWKFYSVTIPLPRDPAWRKSMEVRYARAIELLESGKGPEETGVPSLNVREELRADVPANPSP